MGSFGWGALALALLALLFVVYPLLRRPAGGKEAGQTDSNVALFDEHLRELQQQQDRGEINAEQFAELRRELERTLLNESTNESGTEANRGIRQRQGGWLIWALLFVVPASAVMLYQQLGASQDLTIIDQLTEVSELRQGGDEAAATRKRAALMTQIDERLAEQPDNFYYWVIRARLATDQQDYLSALNAYRSALPLSPQDVTLMEEYLQVAFLVAGGKPTQEINALVQRILTLSPDNMPVLGLSGRLAYEAGDYARAVTDWQKVLRLLPPEHQTAQLIQQELAVAKQALAEGGNQAADQRQGPAATIDVVVELANELTFNTGDTLFVIARRIDQPGPPLAVKRLSATAFPLQLTLTDSDLMLPGGSLGDEAQLQLVARLSSSGAPMPQPGDREGRVAKVDVSADLVTNIEIDHLIE